VSAKKANKLDKIVAETRRQQDQRAASYRGQALKLYPWICGRCGREFSHSNLQELTVHHKNHDHDHNPPDGSNWELLCLYCHDNEHQRQLEQIQGSGASSANDQGSGVTHKPFSDLEIMLKGEK
jgi:HNH endonuclease